MSPDVNNSDRNKEIREQVIKDLKRARAPHDEATVDELIKSASQPRKGMPTLLDELYPQKEETSDTTS